MRNSFILILVTGILVRLILAFTTFHSDLQHFYLAGQLIGTGNILNLYDYKNILFNYPPAVYFFLGPVTYLLTLPFGREFLDTFLINPSANFGDLRLNLLLSILKIPYLPFDLLVGIVLYRYFEKPKEKLLAFAMWMFNPLALYATYMMGQFDIIPTFLTMFALYLAVKKSKYFSAAFILGLGASFKIFPFLFLVPLALLREKWPDRLKVVGIGILTYVVTISPFLNSPGFRATALVAGQTTKSLYAKIDISGGEAILLFPLAVLFFYLVFLYSKSLKEFLWQRFFILLLVFFIFTHYHPQWFLWLTPFLVIDLVKTNLKHWPLVAIAFVSWLGLVTLFDPGLTVWLFSPIFPNLYGQVGIWESLGIKVDLNMARSVLQTIFVSVGAYYIYHHFPREGEA